MAPLFSLLRDVNPSTSEWAMHLRVVRAYDVPVFGNKSELSSLEIIFHDKEEARIHATIKASTMKVLKQRPMEGHLYELKDFIVTDNRMKFRTTNHPMKIIFLRKTKMEEIYDDEFPKSMFLFKPFKDFEALKDTPQFDLFDVIGKLTSCQISPIQTAKGRRLEFTLEDLEQVPLSCTLWDEYADALMPFLDQQKSQNVVVLLQFGHMSVFGGNVKLSNTFNVTKIIINGDSEEFDAFNKKLENSGVVAATIATFESSQITALANAFNSGESIVKNLAEILSYNEAGVFWVSATIIEVEVLGDWFYLACSKCSKKLIPQNGVMFCAKCIKVERNGNYRYKIKVTVHDESGSARFLLWDKECFELIRKTAGEIKDSNSEAFDFLPKEAEEALNDRVGLFKIQVREGDNLRNTVTYIVLKMTDDTRILSIYKDKYVLKKQVLKICDINEDETISSNDVRCSENEKQASDDEDEQPLIKRIAKDDGVDFAGTKKKKKLMKKEK